MNLEKISPISIQPAKEKGLESVLDWFDQHKQSFYILGCSYLSNQRQMEELFYQLIVRAHKEWPIIKRETSSEMWVTSLLIAICRELSSDSSLLVSGESEPRQGIFKALDQLEKHEKDAIVLTYVKGIPQEEAVRILHVSAEEMKEYLFSGIQTVRRAMGYGATFNGCKEYHKDYLDYLEGSMDRSDKIDLEVHIYHCQNCQEDLATFQEVMLTMLNLTEKVGDLHVPSGFMEKVKARLEEDEKRRQQKLKKRKRMGLVFASVFVLFMGFGFFTGIFANLYYTWTVEDLELRAFLQQDLGERLDLVAESNGVKIKIKSAIADDVQTLVFYEIEDTEEDNQYWMAYHEGAIVENEYEIMQHKASLMYYPPDFESDVNNEQKNVFKGKMSLLPLKEDKATIKLKITTLQKLVRDTGNQGYENPEFETGEWNFEIPVTKKPSTKYTLDREVEIEGIPVRMDQLTIAPTATILQYGINSAPSKKRIDVLNFSHLEVNNKKLKVDKYSRAFVDTQQNSNWYTFATRFDPIQGEKPKDVSIQFESVHLSAEDQKTIELDASKEYPQTFEYAGSTISIDKVEIGQPTTVVLSNHEIENRQYEMLHFNIIGEDHDETSSMEMNTEGTIIDKNGTRYDMNNIPIAYEKLENPRYFITVQRMKLHSNNPEEKVIPKRLELYGYNLTKYLDDIVKFSLD
jgi:DNA-directed RNA polymerase specialized sigma24 family protein